MFLARCPNVTLASLALSLSLTPWASQEHKVARTAYKTRKGVERVVLHVRQMLPEWGLAMAKGGEGATVSWWLFCVSLCEPVMA